MNVVSLQKGHLGLCVLLTKRQFLVSKTNPGTDTTWQRVILWKEEDKGLLIIFLV